MTLREAQKRIEALRNKLDPTPDIVIVWSEDELPDDRDPNGPPIYLIMDKPAYWDEL